MKHLPLVLLLALALTVAAAPVARADDRPAESRIDLTFRDTPLREALAQIAKATGRDVEVAPDVEGQVTLRMSGVTWDQAIGLLAGSHDLHVTSKDGVVHVAPSPTTRKANADRGLAAARARIEQMTKALADAKGKVADLDRLRAELAAKSGRLELGEVHEGQADEEGRRILRGTELASRLIGRGGGGALLLKLDRDVRAPAARKEKDAAQAARQATERKRALTLRLQRAEKDEDGDHEAHEWGELDRGELQRILEELARAHGDAQPGSDVRVHVYDVRDLEGNGPHPDLAAAVAAIVKKGGVVEAKPGSLVVKADAQLQARVMRLLGDLHRADAPRPAPPPDVVSRRGPAPLPLEACLENLRVAAHHLEAAGARDEMARVLERIGALEREREAQRRARHPDARTDAADPAVAALRRDVQALRGEVRELTALVRKLLEQHQR